MTETPDISEERLMNEIRTLLGDLHVGGINRLRWDTALAEEFELDSLSNVELQDRLEQTFGVRLPDEVLSHARTPREWLVALRVAAGSTSSIATPKSPETSKALPGRRQRGAPWAENVDTLVAALQWHAERHSDFVAVRLLGNGGEQAADDLSYGVLEEEASACAGALLAEGLGHGERVAIMLPTGRDYFVVSMGVMMAGAVPVPVYPPAQLSVLEDHLRNQALLLANASVSVLVTVPEAMLPARLLRAHVPSLRSVHTPGSLRSASRSSGALPVASADDIALIQYTSGSTGNPKGVVLTHAQLLANIRAMGSAAEVESTDVFVSWLPLYHDMGLIGAWHAASLVFGMLLVVGSPLQFLARPASWLEAMTTYSGTLSAAPNFAYQMCVDRVRESEMANLDLSSWRLTFNGSEPVSAATTEAFCQRFAAVGFRPGTMSPAYGLAEVGVGLTFTPPGRGALVDQVRPVDLAHGRAVPALAGQTDSMSLVSSGKPLPGYEVRVVDKSGSALPERYSGRVQCRGPSTTAGYFANNQANEGLFDHGWLETGDTGYLADGELYLVGRAKDIVIRAGRNLYPEELEQELGRLPGLHPEAVAVFGVADPELGTERLVAAAEVLTVDPSQEVELRDAIARRSLELTGVRPDEVVLLAPGAILRTASGKVRRGATREAFVAGTLGRPPPGPSMQLAHFAWSGIRPWGVRLRARARAFFYAARVWAVAVIIAAPVWLMILLPLSPRGRWRLARNAGRLLQRAAGIELQVEGTLPDPASPAIVVANHQSFVDGLVLLLLSPDPLVFVSSVDFERQFLAGTLLRRLGCEFVHRGEAEHSQADLDQLTSLARRGARLMIFPEGSMTGIEGIGRFRLGAFAVASAVGCPVVPVGIEGSRKVVAPGHYLVHRTTVRATVGASLEPTGVGFLTVVELAEKTRRTIAGLVDESLLE